MNKYIVRIEYNVWLTSGIGDPPTTLIQENAKRFNTHESANIALGKMIIKYPFRNYDDSVV